MTQPDIEVTGYASVADFELRTGINVPVEKEPMVQQRLNDTSAFISAYFGDCADEVEAMFPEILTAVTVDHVANVGAIPYGIRSESVGATSVSYNDPSTVGTFNTTEKDILDGLLARTSCGGDVNMNVGEIGVGWGG